MKRLKLNLPHPIETAWEFVFAEGGSAWAIVTLNDGTVLEGVYANRSAASTKTGERDLYLEVQYTRLNDELVPVKDSAGVWISSTAVKVIEFKKLIEGKAS